MPFKSVDEAFVELLRRIELNPTRIALASQRYNAVKGTIEGNLAGKTVRQIGSFQRKTKIRPNDLGDRLDIDALVSFGRFFAYASGSNGVTPASALQIVRNALSSNETYRVMPQQQDHPVIRLEYADQMSIELVAAFEDCTGQHSHGPGQHPCYVIGASPYAWRAADYDYDAQLISTLNAAAKEKLVPTIKMVKAYFRSRNVPLKSFHTEILVSNTVPTIIADWESKRYSYGYEYILAEFLRRAATIVGSPVSLSGSFSPAMDSDLSSSTLSELAMYLNKRADVAWQLSGDRSAGVISAWREFFGEPFPT